MGTADHIPFVNSETDCKIAQKLYPDSSVIRVCLETLGKTASHLPHAPKKWLDPGMDGLHRWPTLSTAYREHIKLFGGFDRIGDTSFQQKPDKNVVQRFVRELLDACKRRVGFDWLSVPQLPMIDGSGRNKINRMLAEGARLWKAESAYAGKLILPVIFTNQRQINSKTERNKKLPLVLSCLQEANADGVWMVDSTLNDQDGSRTFEQTRFPGLIQLHQELKQQLPGDSIVVGGPYWGMNMVLWARGLVQYSAIGMGNSYQYHVPGSVIMGGKSRLALSPLRRWAIATPALRTWLEKAASQLAPTDPTGAEFVGMTKDFGKLLADGRWQIAEFYKKWFDKFLTLPPSGRALALFQDLSSAYVLGKALPMLPKEEKTARSPARVAKQLMLNCL
jgi:hypothetical protein